MSSPDPQDEAAPPVAWQQSEDAPVPEDSQPEPPNGPGDSEGSSEYTMPHTYASAGYLARHPQGGEDGASASYGYQPPPSAPQSYGYQPPPSASGEYLASRQDEPVSPPRSAGEGLPATQALPSAPGEMISADTVSATPPPVVVSYETGPEPGSYSDPEAMAGSYAPAGAAPPAGYAAQPQGPWRQPEALDADPRPEDLLLPDRPKIAQVPAAWGWRGRVNRLSAGAIKAGPSTAELNHRRAILAIQHGFSRPMTVVVIQPKGGAGKTPMTIGIAAALGVHRGGYIVGWDDNETRGTLAVRTANRDSQRTTVWELLGALPSFEQHDARVGDLSHYLRGQGEAHFDALVSDDHPGHMAQIGEEEFHRIHAVLQRFYRIIVIDTGNNVRSPNWQAAVNAADVVVIPTTYQRDVGYSGSWVLDHLQQTGREQLARNAVTALTAADPTIDAKLRRELLRHFGTRTQDVIEIPFDAHIATGGPIHWAQLNEQTRHALTHTAAAVVAALTRR